MRITLKKTPLNDWENVRHGVILCSEKLSEFIEVPDVKRLTAVISGRPSKNRLAVILPEGVHDDVEVDGEKVELTVSTDQFLFSHFKPKQTIYVEFQY